MSDTTTRLKMQIGPHVFDAEGPTEIVKEQLEAFKQMIASSASTITLKTPKRNTDTDADGWVQESESLIKIFKVDDRVVSLTVRAKDIEESILLLVYGQRTLRKNDSVTGAEVIEGLQQSGVRIGRVDRLLEKAGEIGDVIVVGVGRGKRYRLTNSGFAKAQAIASELIATVA